MYFLQTLQVRAPCHGGVLYSFWYWWNVVWIFDEFFKYWKNNNLKKICCHYFMFSSRFMLFPTFKKKIWCKKNQLKFIWGGGRFFIFRKTLLSHFISGFMLFSTLHFFLEILKKCPITYWLSGRWFLQIVDRDSGNLYPIYPLILICYLKCGGGRNVFLAFYAIYTISRKK